MPVRYILEIISRAGDKSRKQSFCLRESLVVSGIQYVGENYGSFVGFVGVAGRTGCQNMIISRNKNKQKFRSTTSTS